MGYGKNNLGGGIFAGHDKSAFDFGTPPQTSAVHPTDVAPQPDRTLRLTEVEARADGSYQFSVYKNAAEIVAFAFCSYDAALDAARRLSPLLPHIVNVALPRIRDTRPETQSGTPPSAATKLPADSDRRSNPDKPPFTKEDPGGRPATHENPHPEWRPPVAEPPKQ